MKQLKKLHMDETNSLVKQLRQQSPKQIVKRVSTGRVPTADLQKYHGEKYFVQIRGVEILYTRAIRT